MLSSATLAVHCIYCIWGPQQGRKSHLAVAFLPLSKEYTHVHTFQGVVMMTKRCLKLVSLSLWRVDLANSFQGLCPKYA